MCRHKVLIMKKNRKRYYIPVLFALMLFILPACDTKMDEDLETALERDNLSSSEASIYTVPVADAGGDLSINLGDSIILDGSESHDADNDPLTYKWDIIERPTGSTFSLSNAAYVSPTFTPNASGTYEIELTVDDGTQTATDTITVTVDGEPPPVRETQSDDSDDIDTCFISILIPVHE